MYKNKILSNISWISLQDFPSQILGIVFFTVLGRQLGEYGLGSYSYVFSLLAIVNLFIDFGLSNHFWRRWSSNEDYIVEDQSTYLSAKLVTLLLTLIPFTIYIVIFDYGLWSFFLLGAIYTFLDLLRMLPIFAFQSTNNFKPIFVSNMTERLISFGLGSLVLILTHSLHLTLLLFILARFIATVIAFKYYSYPFSFSWNFKKAQQLLIQNKQVFLITLLSYMYFKVDIIVMRRILGVEEVGLYSSAYRILDALTIVPNILLFSIFPSLSHMSFNDDTHSINQLIEKAIKYLFAFGLYVAIITQFYSKEILSFFYTNSFLPAAPTLTLLGWSTILIFIAVPLVYVHLAQKNDTFLLKRLVFLTILNVALNIILLPQIGIIGAAIATILTEVVSILFLLKYSTLQVTFNWLPRLLLIAVILVSIFVFIHPPLIVMGLLSFSSYGLLLLLFKIIDLNDIQKSKL